MASVEDVDANGVPIRIYEPPTDLGSWAVIYFHGGGFVTGSIRSYDTLLRRLSQSLRQTVVAVDYRLAPESPFPAAIEDSQAAVHWVASRFSDRRMILVGDSAGGNITAVTSRHFRGVHEVDIAAQVLIYPMTDNDVETPSFEEFSEGFGLTKKHMEWFWSLYAPEPEQADVPRLAPVKAEYLSGLPPALIITAECDVLAEEGQRYARRLVEADVTVLFHCMAGQIHGFLGDTQSSDSSVALDMIAGGLKVLMAPSLSTTS
jgi:acetyl esterase